MLNAPSRKNRCAFLNWCLPLEYSLMMRMTFWLVGMRRYIASWSTCGSYNGELISIIPSRKLQITDVLQCPTSRVPVTFSSRISFLLSALNKIRLEWSSTTSIFHLAGGWTDRMASRSSTTIIKKRSIFYWYSSTYFLLQSEWAKSWTMNECVEGQQLGSDRREVGGGSDEVI